MLFPENVAVFNFVFVFMTLQDKHNICCNLYVNPYKSLVNINTFFGVSGGVIVA